MGIKVIASENYDEMCDTAAHFISAQLTLKPDSILGLATGASPLGIYHRLAEEYRKGAVSFSHCDTFNLDEYCGLQKKHKQSYAFYMEQNLFSKVDIQRERVHLLDGTNPDENTECGRYDQQIEKLGGIDLQLLGIGRNGHIGFNEPGEEFPMRTHKVRLSESTVQANSRFFQSKDQVPRFAYTMGIQAILQAKRILLVVSGPEKSEILEKALFGPVCPQVPASILQAAREVIVCGDRESLAAVMKKHPLI